MKTRFFILVLIIIFSLSIRSDAMLSEEEYQKEEKIITQVIKNSIGWALDKDLNLLYESMAQDSNFFIFHPNDNTITNFDDFKKLAESVFMNDAFKATGYEVKDLRVNISNSGDVAWYSCILDDFGEWNGQSTSWINARWTGVLEKRKGKWVIAQMHFSFSTDKKEEE